MIIPENTVSDFEQITNYPLSTFLTDFSNFVTREKSSIIAYYSGQTTQPRERSFEELRRLIVQIDEIMIAANNHRDTFENAAFWELLDVLTEIDTSLATIDNSSKWLRSVIGKNDFSSTMEREDFLRQLETLEMLSSRFGSNDPDNDWSTIALRNDLIEEDYTSDGGNVLRLDLSKKRRGGLVTSVVDTLQGKRIYGIDLLRKITFDSNQDDLVALSYDNTVKQSVTILMSLKQGDTPEFPLEGIQRALVVGSNRNAVAYPILFRQFYNSFKTDDTLASLTIIDILNQNDSLSITFSINTVLGESLTEESLL